jgi:hypothetical protein
LCNRYVQHVQESCDDGDGDDDDDNADYRPIFKTKVNEKAITYNVINYY